MNRNKKETSEKREIPIKVKVFPFKENPKGLSFFPFKTHHEARALEGVGPDLWAVGVCRAWGPRKGRSSLSAF